MSNCNEPKVDNGIMHDKYTPFFTPNIGLITPMVDAIHEVGHGILDPFGMTVGSEGARSDHVRGIEKEFLEDARGYYVEAMRKRYLAAREGRPHESE